jgi:hypothetical protein
MNSMNNLNFMRMRLFLFLQVFQQQRVPERKVPGLRIQYPVRNPGKY